MLYGKLSTGHKAGGFNDTFQATGSPIPESLQARKTASTVARSSAWRKAFESRWAAAALMPT